MKACVVLHNLIIENAHDSYDLAYDYDHVEDRTSSLMSVEAIIRAMGHTIVE